MLLNSGAGAHHYKVVREAGAGGIGRLLYSGGLAAKVKDGLMSQNQL